MWWCWNEIKHKKKIQFAHKLTHFIGFIQNSYKILDRDAVSRDAVRVRVRGFRGRERRLAMEEEFLLRKLYDRSSAPSADASLWTWWGCWAQLLDFACLWISFSSIFGCLLREGLICFPSCLLQAPKKGTLKTAVPVTTEKKKVRFVVLALAMRFFFFLERTV